MNAVGKFSRFLQGPAGRKLNRPHLILCSVGYNQTFKTGDF